MFRINNGHLQLAFFSYYSTISSQIQERLKQAWASVCYNYACCRIDEASFASLFFSAHCRSNFPINFFLSLKIRKYLRDDRDVAAMAPIPAWK